MPILPPRDKQWPFLRAFGSWLPPRRVTNRELAPQLDATPEWILEVSGIEERRYAAETDTVAGIGVLAAQNCLEKAGATAAELGMILVASGSSDAFVRDRPARSPLALVLPQLLPSTSPFPPPGRSSHLPWPRSFLPPPAAFWWWAPRSCRAASRLHARKAKTPRSSSVTEQARP